MNRRSKARGTGFTNRFVSYMYEITCPITPTLPPLEITALTVEPDRIRWNFFVAQFQKVEIRTLIYRYGVILYRN